MHDSLPVGRYWDKMTNYEQRAECRHCGTIESLEHIFTECRYSGQKIIWEQTQKIFEKKKIPWVPPTLGTVLGCGISELKNKKGQLSPPRNRLYSLVTSEALSLVWKIRCEWRMQKGEETNEAHTEAEILNRWIAQLNRVLRFDILSTWYPPKGKTIREKDKEDMENLVIDTWWDVVSSNTDLEWEVTTKKRRKKTGVLVGTPAPEAGRRVPHSSQPRRA